jgi:hypothetical protein
MSPVPSASQPQVGATMRLNGRLKVSVSTMPMRITTRRSVSV